MKKNRSTKYIDAFVLVVPTKEVAKYKKMAREAAESWMRHGALCYRECIGDDLHPDMGGYPYLPFPKLAKLKPSESVFFSYIEYESKAHRNQVNKRVNKEMEKWKKEHPNEEMDMPFDSKKMAYGGFKVVVSSEN